jgi:hypothetical protein
MRYMTGGSLADQIQRGKFSIQDAARIIERLASALAYAHRKGIVHRDLKPDNILFDSNGEPFISDFGVAKFETPATNLTGSGIIGTPAYMSPEQAQGEQVDNRSDIYGLGVIIFQMLSGRQPYQADTPMGLAIKHVTEPVPEILKANPTLPPATDLVIRTAMAKDRTQRYASVTDLSAAFKEAASGENKTLPPTRVASPTGRGRRGLVVGGLIVLAVAAGAFWFREPLLAAVLPEPTPTLTPAPTFTAIPSTPTDAPTVVPATLTPTLPVFAAFCQPDSLPVPKPVVLERNKACAEKQPYTTVSIPRGATFESLSPEMTCEVSVQQANDVLVTCSSPNSFFYQLRVCNPPPPVAPASEPGRCAEGLTYDPANQCCLKPPPRDAGCITFQVDMKTCAE